MDPRGRQVRGVVSAPSEALAFDDLKRKGLSPIRLAPLKEGAPTASNDGLSAKQTADLLFELSALMEAGADVKSALSITAAKLRHPGMAAAVQAIIQRVSGGDRLSDSIRVAMGASGRFAAALTAAGEAKGDIAAGLRQGSDLLRSELMMKGKLIEALSYPAFILISSVGALLVILVYVVPSLEPLMQTQGGGPPGIMAALLFLSRLLRDWGTGMVVGLIVLLVGLLFASRMGVLATIRDKVLVDGPARSLLGSFIFGRFAQVLGRLQAAGVPLSEAMRLAEEALGSPLARQRISAASRDVRQGQPLSSALERVPGFPDAIVRLTIIGERTGELGAMLDRAGTLELEALVRRIDRLAKVLGPAMIILLGIVIGLMMGGLLSGVSTLGEGL